MNTPKEGIIIFFLFFATFFLFLATNYYLVGKFSKYYLILTILKRIITQKTKKNVKKNQEMNKKTSKPQVFFPVYQPHLQDKCPDQEY